MGMGDEHREHPQVVPSQRPRFVSWIEAGAIASFALIQVTGWINIGTTDLIDQRPILSHFLFLAIAISSWMVADFFSGLAHYIADNHGTETTPIIGPTLIGPFREHHFAPRAMLKHGFLERNGNSALIALPTIAWIPFLSLSPLFRGLAMGVLMMTLWIVLTNQIHAWAHEEHPPRWVALLQKWGVLLSPERHAIHHAPYDDIAAPGPVPTQGKAGGNYCITSGVCDRMAGAVGRLFRGARPLNQRAFFKPLD